jgi:hypothetical protein
VRALLKPANRLIVSAAKICMTQQMQNSVGEKGADLLPGTTLECGADIADMEDGASWKWETSRLAPFIDSTS